MRSTTTEIMASLKSEQIVSSIRCQIEKVPVKAMFTLTVFEILLLEGRSVLSPTQRGTESKKSLISSEKPNNHLAFIEIT